VARRRRAALARVETFSAFGNGAGLGGRAEATVEVVVATPTFCMNAYTLVGPTKRYPCDFNCFANASASGVDVGRSARDRGACVRVNS
jgi:hypothetical protein